MANPTSWQVLEHVRDAIKLIQTSRGFNTDIGLGIVAMEASQLPEDDAPHTLILAEDIAVDEEASTRSTTTSEMDIVVEFSVSFTSTDNAQLVAHRARADVMQALIPLRKHPKDRPLGVRSFVITGSRIGQPESGATTIIAQVTARAGLSESLQPANP